MARLRCRESATCMALMAVKMEDLVSKSASMATAMESSMMLKLARFETYVTELKDLPAQWAIGGIGATMEQME